ncbi:MAG TPA: hypothetical protein VIY96_10540, partial [Thermoanaerobaculia bacterium]
KEAGAIDAAALAAIESEFSHPRLELARAWKVLIFVLVSAAVIGVQFGVFGLDAKGSGRFFVYAAILAAVTEALRGSRLAGTGSDGATSFWAAVMLIIASGILLDAGKSRGSLIATIALAGGVWAAACTRWGFSLYGAFAAVAGFLWLAMYPSARLVWAVVGTALCVLSAWLSDRPFFSPSRRRAFAGVFVVSALALYGAVNVYSVDERIVERTGNWGDVGRATLAAPGARSLFVVATALLPIVFVVWGIRARRRLVLDTGALLAALSFLTLEHYVRFGSPAVIAFGLALVGLALWLTRLFARAPGEELSGFTASAHLAAESESAGPAAALVAAAAAPISMPESARTFSPGGGRSGGGGATGTI